MRAHELVTAWWEGEHGAAATLLDGVTAPLEWTYRALIGARAEGYERGVLRVHRVRVPVISIGNISVGGTGKTPVAAWLLGQLRARGRHPALLHGAYAADEPELHRRWNPDVLVVAERDRVSGAARAIAAGADVIVLDDGFQHRRLGRDLDIVLVAAEQWTGRRRLLPRGPWREPPQALRRAGIIGVTRRLADPAQAAATALDIRRVAPEARIMQIALRPAGWWCNGHEASAPPGEALAVAAVAQPVAFLENARAAGAVITQSRLFRDHHAYSAADAAAILAAAGGRPIVMTEKDSVKLDARLPGAQLWVLRQSVTIEEGGAHVAEALDRVLG